MNNVDDDDDDGGELTMRMRMMDVTRQVCLNWSSCASKT